MRAAMGTSLAVYCRGCHDLLPMVTLEFPRAPDLPVKFAKSALWETVACARLIARGRRGPPPGVSAADVPMLSALLGCDQPYLPDFLAPPPAGGAPSFGDELARMRRTPPSVVAAELARMHPRPDRSAGIAVLARHDNRADVVLATLAAELELVWERVTRVAWPRIDAILEADILTRARWLAAGGLGSLFTDLRGLELDTRRLTVRSARDRRCVRVERELLLVPSVLGAPEVFAVLDLPWASSVYYPARGAAGIWDAGAEATGWLETLAGRARARVLECVHEPSTTGEVAARLRIAPASASQHLQRLVRAGLVHRTRAGTRVFYTLSGRGRRLLALPAD